MPDNQNSSEWVMVPREMTDAMREAAGSADDVDDCYSAMIAAAPPAPAMLNGVEYDRELIAEMLDDLCAKVPNSETKFSHWSMQEMARLLRAADEHEARTVSRAADNRDAAGVDDPLRMRLIDLLFTEAAAQTETGITGLADKILALIATPAAAPAGEAVAWIIHSENALTRVEFTSAGMRLGYGKHPVYTHPPAAEVREVDEAMKYWKDRATFYREQALALGYDPEVPPVPAALSPPGRD